jgi:hypothetical protein
MFPRWGSVGIGGGVWRTGVGVGMYRTIAPFDRKSST